MRPSWAAVTGFLALAGCQFQQQFEEYCLDTGFCQCTEGVCCAEFGQECGSLGCCDGMYCGPSGLCEGSVHLVFDPPTLELRADDVGVAPPPAHVRLSNLGQRTATNLALRVDPDIKTEIRVDFTGCGRELASGESCDIRVSYTPTTPERLQVQLVASSAGNGASALVSAITGVRLSLEYQRVWQGSIHSDPGGINCPDVSCEMYVVRGTSVRLYDDGVPGVRGTVGPPCGDLPCTVTVDDDLSLSAKLVPFLTVERKGIPGSNFLVNSRYCSDFAGCSYALSGRTEIALDGLSVVPWTTGPCANQEPGCILDLQDPVTVEVEFQPLNRIWLAGPIRPVDVGPGGAEADIRCNGGIAWLFTSTRDPRTALAASRGWSVGDVGWPFIDRLSDVVSGRVQSRPVLGSDAPIISGLQPGGALPRPADVCNDFASSSGTMVAGSSGLGGIAWYHDEGRPPLGCTEEGYVICFAPGSPVRVLPPYQDRRLAFLSQPWIPAGGVTSADAFCQAQAIAAGLSGTYRALLASTGGSAINRFVVPSGRGWRTVTGVRLEPPWGATSSFPVTPYLNATADGGIVLSTGDASTGTLVWSDEASTSDLDTCLSWAGGASRTGRVRRPEGPGPSTTRVSCGTAQRLVCLQDE